MNRNALGTVIALVAGLVLLSAAPASVEASVEVSAGDGYSCAIKVDQTITCWGLDDHGEGTPPLGTFTAIDAGAHHACAIRTDGTVECWGNNADGEATPPSGTFTEVSAGGDHSCGLRTDSTLACWGRNTQSPPVQRGTGRQFSSGQRREHGGHDLELRGRDGRQHHLLGLQLLRPRQSSPGGVPRCRRRWHPWMCARIRRQPFLLGRVHGERSPVRNPAARTVQRRERRV